MTSLAGVVDGLLVRRVRLLRVPAGTTSRQTQRRAVRIVALVLALLAIGLGLRDAQDRSPAPGSPTPSRSDGTAERSPTGTDGDGGSSGGRGSRGAP